MKSVSRIFSAIVCSTSLFAFDAYGAVATTAGSNLTAYNASNTNNNQWATLTNGRYDSTASAKADFGNCNAVVLRCAQPKCANGGCAETSVAAAIVSGCVKSNDKCKQYGDDLINYMTGQLVASSTAKVNAANAEQIQAAQAAAQQAQAAAQQAASQSAQQMAEMQSSMQQQMQQMQQQMAEQQAQSAQQIADALAQSQKQQAAAISDMRSAAETAAKAQVAGTVVTAEDKAAISRGVSEDVLTREKIGGQVITEIDDAKNALKEVKVVMDKAFEYAKCDGHGNNCSGPVRIKKWRELATKFTEPYDTVVEKIYEALITAQTVGVDVDDVYMMLNNSCNSWGEYLCPGGGRITYTTDSKGQKGAPEVCANLDFSCFEPCPTQPSEDENISICDSRCSYKKNLLCQPCTLLKLLPDKEEVYQSWINTERSSNDNQVLVACASGAISGNNLLARHAKRKSGAGVLDLDILEEWINQREPDSVKTADLTDINNKYCANKTDDKDFVKALNSKTITPKILCGKNYDEKEGYCEAIEPAYGICDVHAFNKNLSEMSSDDDISKTKEVIGKKITLISQQLYKQYEYLNATVNRLKIQLEKAVLTTQLEKAGAGSSGSGGGSGSSRNDDKTIYLAGAENCSNKSSFENGYACLQSNISLILTAVSSNVKQACNQLISTVDSAKVWGVIVDDDKTLETPSECKNLRTSCGKDIVRNCAQKLNVKVLNAIRNENRRDQGIKYIAVQQ